MYIYIFQNIVRIIFSLVSYLSTFSLYGHLNFFIYGWNLRLSRKNQFIMGHSRNFDTLFQFDAVSCIKVLTDRKDILWYLEILSYNYLRIKITVHTKSKWKMKYERSSLTEMTYRSHLEKDQILWRVPFFLPFQS